MKIQGEERPLLSVQAIRKTINNQLIVGDVSFYQHRFQKIAIAGETGSGKSTLLKMIAGLVQPDGGKILFEGKAVAGPDYQLVPGEPGIAYLSQHYELRNHYRMEELLSYASTLHEKEAGEIYRICRIDHLLKRNTFQLSGGEKQRIALARLLVSAPKLLLLDEPFSNLDLIHKRILKTVIGDISETLGITCILASHDPLDALSWADHMIILKNGCLVQQEPPAALYYRPRSEYVAGLLGRYNIIGPRLADALALPSGDPKAKMLLRPEFLYVSQNRIVGSIPATIDRISFCGPYYELEMHTGESSVLATVLHNVNQPGDTVYVSIDKRRVAYVTAGD